MPTYSTEISEPTQVVANKFKKNFINYTEKVKVNIEKESESLDEMEIFIEYLEFIEKKAGIGKKNSMNHSYFIDNFIKKESLNKVKSDEIIKLFNLYNKKIKFESDTINNRDMNKTLNILNENHNNLIKSLKRIKKSFESSDNWVNLIFEDEIIYSLPLQKITNNYKEGKNDKRYLIY